MRFFKRDLETLYPIIKAMNKGIPIQWRKIQSENWNELHSNSAVYDFNLALYEYHIKPESQLVPFTFEDAELLIGKAVRNNETKNVGIISFVREFDCKVFTDLTFYDLMVMFTFLDGTPCGKLVETSNK